MLFAYPMINSELLATNTHVHQLCSVDQDIDDALVRLGQAVSVDAILPEDTAVLPEPPLGPLPQGPLNPTSIAQSLSAQLPEHGIIVDEGIVGGSDCFEMTAAAASHDWIIQTGGSIGWGLPAAVGAAVACPNRKAICLEGDGSAMYTIQALWTMAWQQRDITTLVFANRQVAILQLEFMRVGAEHLGASAASQMNIGNPDTNTVEPANSMAVSASRAERAEEFNQQFQQAMTTPGPQLIEATI